MNGGDARVVYVTGKGGAGKSTVSSLLARRAAARGLRVALVETGVPAGGAGRSTTDPGVAVFALDERAALGQLVARLLRVPFLAGRLMDSRSFSAVAGAAPGVRELVYLSYIFDVAGARLGGGPFDLVVVDGFATGHTLGMLASPYTSADLIPIGPAARIARNIGRATSDAGRFRVLAVTLAEELAATECRELHARLAELRIASAATIVNAVYPPVLDDEQRAWLSEAARPAHRKGNGLRGSADALLYEARRQRQSDVVANIEAEGMETLTLPYDFDSGDGRADATEAIDQTLDLCLETAERARP